MSKTDQRTAFYASVRAIDAMCPACKQPQNAPSCERREHWLPSAIDHSVNTGNCDCAPQCQQAAAERTIR